MTMKTKPRVGRTGARMIRIAYNLQEMAMRLRAAGHDMAAEICLQAGSKLGEAGRDLDRRIGKRD